LIQQTTYLLRLIWMVPLWRDDVLTTFEQWIQDGASRSSVRNKLKIMIETKFTEQVASYPDDVDLEQVNWDQMIEFLCTCFYRKRLHSPLPHVPSDEVWMKLTGEQYAPLSPHPQQDKAIKETVPVPLFPLEQKLLTQGGTRMVYRDEPDLKLLLSRGEPFDEPAELVAGESGQCHLNVARFWNEQREELAIVTGYALSEDGLWRQHSWLIRKNSVPGQSRLIETTIRRVKYFGVRLTEAEAAIFYKRSIGS